MDVGEAYTLRKRTESSFRMHTGHNTGGGGNVRSLLANHAREFKISTFEPIR
jgi:hypothetical protein